MEEQGGSLPSFFPLSDLQLLLLLAAATLLLLLLFDVDDSGSAMTVDETKADSARCDTGELATVTDIVADDIEEQSDDNNDDCHRVMATPISPPPSLVCLSSKSEKMQIKCLTFCNFSPHVSFK